MLSLTASVYQLKIAGPITRRFQMGSGSSFQIGRWDMAQL
jgi:hypothetical protein